MLVFPVSFWRFEQCLHHLRLYEERRRCPKNRVQHLFLFFFPMFVSLSSTTRDIESGFGQPFIYPSGGRFCRSSKIVKPIRSSQRVFCHHGSNYLPWCNLHIFPNYINILHVSRTMLRWARKADPEVQRDGGERNRLKCSRHRPSPLQLCARQLECRRAQEKNLLQWSLLPHCWEVEGVSERWSLLPHSYLLAEVIDGVEDEVR